MNRYLEKIAEKAEHDWSPAIVGGLADIPAGAAIGWAGHELGKKFLGGRTALATGLVSGVTTGAAADYLQRRAEKKAVLEKKGKLHHIPGVGRHNDIPDSKFRSGELKKGRKVEKEHTRNYQAAEDIAKDHLTEIPDYYSRLAQMEGHSKKADEYADLALLQDRLYYSQPRHSRRELFLTHGHRGDVAYPVVSALRNAAIAGGATHLAVEGLKGVHKGFGKASKPLALSTALIAGVAGARKAGHEHEKRRLALEAAYLRQAARQAKREA